MPRAKRTPARRKAKKRVFKSVKGHRGTSGRAYRKAKEASIRAQANATVDRKLRKRDFRKLWITRISAACGQRGMRYSLFINGLKKAGIELNRKMLSEIAIDDPKGFDAIFDQAKSALDKSE